jgi:hypothetical protein
MSRHLTIDELESALDDIRQSPKDEGPLELIVRRPKLGEREELQEADLHPVEGLVGDSWIARSSTRTTDGSPHPHMQLNVMNSRVIALLAQDRSRWQLAGDQLFVDLDLSSENLPPWTKIALGSAVIEITDQPHTGCNKFIARFGVDAARFVNSATGSALHLRGINARVLKQGRIRIGDVARKIDSPSP